MARTAPKPRRSRLIWPLVGLITIVIAVGGCAVWQASHTQTPQQVTPDAYRQWVYGGLPKSSQALTLLKNKGYLVGYDEARKNPAWVAYRLFKVENPQTHPRPSRFLPDDRTVAKVKHEDYTGSGYDRGHMAPNYAIDICYGEDGQRETFLMSNICPQAPKLNRQVWEHLERTEIRDYAVRLQQIWVIDGPIYDGNSTSLPSGVTVPSKFFKIILGEDGGKPRMLAFIMPQGVHGDEKPVMFLVSVDEIQKLTGLDFFSDLEDELEKKLEGEKAKEMW